MLCLWWYFLVAGGYKLRTGGTVNIVWNTGEKKSMMHICVHQMNSSKKTR